MRKEIIKIKVIILLVFEINLNSCFTLNQYHVDGFTSPLGLIEIKTVEVLYLTLERTYLPSP